MRTDHRPTLAAAVRQRGLRKSDLRRMRLAGETPGEVYGHGEPELISVSRRELDRMLRHHPAGALIEIDLAGCPVTALIRELERDPVSSEVIHIGLQRVGLRERVRSVVPVVFAGEDRVIRHGFVLQRQIEELEVQGRADLLPESIVVDVHDARPGATIRIGDLPLPEGIVSTRDPDLPVATISLPSVPADVEEVLDAEETEHELVEAT